MRSWHDPNSDHVHAPTQLGGTITGITFTVIVAVLALSALTEMVFLAARQKPT